MVEGISGLLGREFRGERRLSPCSRVGRSEIDTGASVFGRSTMAWPSPWAAGFGGLHRCQVVGEPAGGDAAD